MTMTVLVVDDNPQNTKLVRALLTQEDYEVMTASDAEEALALLASLAPELRPRCILMDVGLPGMSGLDLTRKLKADAEYREMVIIALTAHAMPEDEKRVRAAGCDGYVTKPLDFDVLLETIARLCP